jgi:hypothetical protein
MTRAEDHRSALAAVLLVWSCATTAFREDQRSFGAEVRVRHIGKPPFGPDFLKNVG